MSYSYSKFKLPCTVYKDIWNPVVGQNNRYDPYAVAVKGHCKGTLRGVLIIGHDPIEISRYLFFAIKHGCSFKVCVSEQTPIRSPLVQGGDCHLGTCWITKVLHAYRSSILGQ